MEQPGPGLINSYHVIALSLGADYPRPLDGCPYFLLLWFLIVLASKYIQAIKT